jgi:hypothetical protein
MKPIENYTQLTEALNELSLIFDSIKGTSDYDKAIELELAIEEYEND